MTRFTTKSFALLTCLSLLGMSCKQKTDKKETTKNEQEVVTNTTAEETTEIQPLITHIYTADPSAHVFDGKIYIYPSHDYESGIPENDYGAHFNMKDYHVFSMDNIDGKVTDHGKVLDVEDVKWAKRQMWAPDAAEKDGKYYLYFPAKDEKDIFRIGVATSDSPAGPFKPEEKPIEGGISIDPAVFKDSDGSYYMYVGGIWGGQLQNWRTGTYNTDFNSPYDNEPEDDEPAIAPRVAKLSDDMLQFAEELKEIEIVDKEGNPILAGDHDRRFFEAAWVHKYNGKYYFSYSTGDTHNIAYAVGDSPYGPFTYQSVILKPVLGWTNHHSIVEIDGKWYIFFHDSSLSGGKTHLRNVKVSELEYNEDGTIKAIDALVEAEK
ncbi:glycoside hydrolase family 43 protein [Galbibacter sp. EGI 63066]|uniref:glycoside hydrolase family 43 protein n=1 Tax=Galbibacter sp. EGI 63066 TaxID=2993559 RepID=UPI002248B241|nr:glycoside hydrolase family 43 protein [Galbibacter sp. EGI 63066]MCX2680240.1 glycoside hydrolase family 43 protein [Galbibacter sp. EGI 63066]